MLAFRLCLALKVQHPDYLTIDSYQFAEWIAFYTLDPFGDQRADLRNGILAAALSNRWRNKSESAAKPTDFCPFIEKRKQQTPEEIKAAMRSFLSR